LKVLTASEDKFPWKLVGSAMVNSFQTRPAIKRSSMSHRKIGGQMIKLKNPRRYIQHQDQSQPMQRLPNRKQRHHHL